MSRRRRRPHRPPEHPGELALAAMVDMMINILMFLLTLYGTDPILVQPTEELQLPDSTTKRPLQAAPDLRVTRSEVLLDGERLLTLAPGPALPADAVVEGELPALRARLQARAAELQADGGATEEPLRIDLQVDRRTPWEILGPVLQTAGAAGFPQYRFVVRQRDGG